MLVGQPTALAWTNEIKFYRGNECTIRWKFHLCIQTMICHGRASVLFMRCHTTARLTIWDAEKLSKLLVISPENSNQRSNFSIGGSAYDQKPLCSSPLGPFGWKMTIFCSCRDHGAGMRAMPFSCIVCFSFFFFPLTHCCFMHLQRRVHAKLHCISNVLKKT